MNSIKSVLPGRDEGKTKGRSLRDAFLLHGRVELHIKCSWMGGLHGGERVETSACGCTPGGMRADTVGKIRMKKKTSTSKSTCRSLQSLTLIDTDIPALGFLQG